MDFTGHSILLSSGLGTFWSYLIILILSSLDTIFIIGTFFPGGIMVMGIGFLSALSNLNIWVSFLMVLTGGMLGDIATYYLGYYGTSWFKEDSKLYKFAYIGKGKRFFEKHGDKSVFLGRFMGILKAVIPFVAGFFKMNFKKFFYLNLLSSFVWTILYLGIGFFLGVSADTFVMSKKVELLFLTIPFIIFGIWILYESREKILKKIKKLF